MTHPFSVAILGAVLSACAFLPPHSADVERTLWDTDECMEIGERSGSPAGAEDIAIDHAAKVAYISTTDRRAIGRGELPEGKVLFGYIYRVRLDVRPLVLIDVTPRELLTPAFRPHGISLYREGDKPPLLLVIDHPPDLTDSGIGKLCGAPSKIHVLAAHDPDGPLVTERLAIESPENLPSPNDIAAVDARRFYATNTFGKSSCGARIKELLFGSQGFISYHDGTATRRLEDVAIPGPNGIAIDHASRRLFVSSLLDGGIRVFQLTDDFAPGPLVKTIWTGGRLDNIDLTGDGSLLVTSHPSTTRFIFHSYWDYFGAPSRVYRVTTGDNPKAVMIYDDEKPKSVSAVSTAALYRDAERAETLMLLGTVFDRKPRVCKVNHG